MEIPFSPLLSEFYVQYFEEKLFDGCKVPDWFRCMEDTFVLVASNTDPSSLLSLVSETDPCI